MGRVIPAYLSAAGVALLGASLVAQGNVGTLRGTVRDPQGALIAGVSVDISCGSQSRHAVTGTTGEFAEANLPRGRCRVTAVSESFEPRTVTGDTDTSLTLVLQVRRYAYEVVVTPTRGIESDTFDSADAVSVTSRFDIDSRPHNLLTQVLGEEPGVLLQQTTSAQTSPVIRGFTGQSNVHLVDGVRFNTGTWRSGPNQYTGWVNEGPIESIEVVRGPASVQYGSDALGGTVQYIVEPLARIAPRQIIGSLAIEGSSANEGFGGQADVAFRGSRGGLRVGGERRRVGDLRPGDGIDSHSAVTTFLGLSSEILGDRQEATAFDMGGGFAVLDLSPAAGSTLHALYLHNNLTGSSRYDRVLGGAGLYRSGFDPQRLDFALARYEKADLGRFDGFSATLSLNRQADGRFEQARPNARLDRQEGTTSAIGYQVQLNENFAGRHQLVVGSEFYDESISASRRLVEPTGVVTAARPDIPDGTTYTSLGVFAQQSVDVVPDRLSVRGGVRFSRFGFGTTADPVLGVIEDDVVSSSMSFQASAVMNLTRQINVTANVSRGFRAPNAADFGSIGLTGGGGFEITPGTAAAFDALVGSAATAPSVSTGEPVVNLRPEEAYQYEFGLKARAGRFSGAISGFDMELYDFIQRRALVFPNPIVGTTISGFQVVRQDAAGLAFIAQDIRPIATRVNIDRARIVGMDGEGEIRFTSSWTAGGYFSMANGRILPQGDFARRMNPPMGGARVRWMGSRLWAEGVLSFATEQTRLSSGDLSDARIGAPRTRTTIAGFFNGTATDMGLVSGGVLRATGETLAQVQDRIIGTATLGQLFTTHPGYAVFGLRAGVQVTPRLDVTAIGENLGDANYRLYGSGLDAPGFNLQVRTRYRF
jgi:hemoglobin/transferrin/lactoferrin receptor protein